MKLLVLCSIFLISMTGLFLEMPLSENSITNKKENTWDFDLQLDNYFRIECEQIYNNSKADLSNVDDWKSYQANAREELTEMLGLQKLSFDSNLNPVTTGKIYHEDFTVEKVHFQSIPGLYVTGNLYIPKDVKEPLPTVLYVCGHAKVKEQGVSFGNKVHYQHHGIWFAKNGYVCLIIDSIQLGEIEGIHHGTYSKNRWWWISRGYTPAGVEALNSMRAIDYLISRPEVDASRLGVTGRSGGGIYSWWLSAIDERIKVAVPTAGITDLKNYVVDGCVDGHCDCMFMANTYRWDYTKVPSLVAPRPLLICNTDRDPIFPLDGVHRVYQVATSMYNDLDSKIDVGLNIVPGVHEDLPDVRLPAFRWFNHYLKGNDTIITDFGDKIFPKEQLKVFEKLPEDEINSTIDEVFVKQADPITKVLEEVSWEEAKDGWRQSLEKYVFRNWLQQDLPPALNEIDHKKNKDFDNILYRLKTDESTFLPVFRVKASSGSNKKVRIIVLDENNWPKWNPVLGHFFSDLPFFEKGAEQAKGQLSIKKDEDLFFISVRGVGPAAFSGDRMSVSQLKRRFYLIGQTLEQMQTWDLVQGVRAIQSSTKGQKISLNASGQFANMLVYSSLYFDFQTKLDLEQPELDHHQGPTYPNILKYMNVPASFLMAAEKHEVNIHIDSDKKGWMELEKLASGYSGFNLSIQEEGR